MKVIEHRSQPQIFLQFPSQYFFVNMEPAGECECFSQVVDLQPDVCKEGCFQEHLYEEALVKMLRFHNSLIHCLYMHFRALDQFKWTIDQSKISWW